MATTNNPPIADYRDNRELTKPTSLWIQASIDGNRWDKYYPYQLMIVRAIQTSTGVAYNTTPYKFTLPIAPQELTIDMPVATNVQSTLDGIVEINNGAPFRDIIIQATTGISPIKNSGAPTQPDGESERVINAIFAGTVANSQALGAIVKPEKPNVNKGLGFGTDFIDPTSTGYYQFQLLEKFIESYANIKKSNVTDVTDLNFNPKDLRLALAMFKDQSVFLCSIVKFTKKRSASNPMEYMYTLQLRGWGRISLNGHIAAPVDTHVITGRNPNKLAEVLNKIRSARQVLNLTGEILQSGFTDAASTVNDILRETTLFAKTLSGTKASLFDFPKVIQDEGLDLIQKNWSKFSQQFEGIIDPESMSSMDNSEANDSETNAKEARKAIKKAQNEAREQSAKNYADTQKAVLDAERQVRKAKVNAASRSNNPDWNIILDAIGPSALPLPTSTISLIQQEIAKTKGLTRKDFETSRNKLRSISNAFAASVGAMSATFAQTYGLTLPTVTRTPTEDEMDILFALNEAIQGLDALVASDQTDPETLTSMEYVAGLAQGAGIAFNVPKSKFAIPFPYGTTLEKLSLQYLGDANRWHEIATLNGLRAPYIDEEGFSIDLLTNGNGNIVQVADITNFYPNQTVWLSSDSERRDKRHIQKIEEISDGVYYITVDGDDNLDKFTTSQNAKIEAFLPGTVNSQQVIYIPSDKEVNDDFTSSEIPGIDQFDPYLKIGGVDLLLKDNGDLAITPDGDCKLAYGLANIIQSIKIALSTIRGSLLQHPEYGLAVPVGVSLADVDPNELLQAAQVMFGNDPTFTGVKSAKITKSSTTLQLTIEVELASINKLIPVTVQIV